MKFIALLLALNLTAAPITQVETAERDCVKLPVFMYHRILRHPTTNDPYTISPEAFESDLKYLSENGYSTVGTQELLDYTENGVSLPSKPVMLTFDDGHFNNLYYAAPLLEKYGMKAVIFAVGCYSEMSSGENTENPNFSYIGWERMENLPPYIEIQNHTWNMHSLNGGRIGIKRRYKESRADYENALHGDLLKMNEKIALHTGKSPCAFALPFGAEEIWAHPILESLGLKICFCSREGVSTLVRGDAKSLRNIRRIVRKPGRSAAALLKKFL